MLTVQKNCERDFTMKIIADCMGSDKGPRELLKGCAAAVAECDVDIIAVGRRKELLSAIEEEGINPSRIEICDAELEMDMHDTPTSVLKEKADSSMGIALKLLRDGKGDALVSAGNTGALLAGGTLIVKRIKGVKRAALAPVLPTQSGYTLLIDSGANTECRAEYLDQFGLMGSVYMKNAEGIGEPRVGLANNGTEDTKGTELCLEAYSRLSQNKNIHFVGNVEGRGLMLGDCDVFVCDGFTGNLVLKTVEGTAMYIGDLLKEAFTQSLKNKLVAFAMKRSLKAFKKKLDYKEVGGAVLLGVCKPVIKAHGSSDARAFKNAIRQAKRFAEGNVIEEIAAAIEEQQKTEQNEAGAAPVNENK